jgi:hypothetical protein
MKYFSQNEQEDMLYKFIEFDADFTNKRYEKAVLAFKERLERLTK